ncbi:hypothetical protein CIB84_013624 [Bambusicola thoracicus]|uniref:Uncharacterized protein n=1 Tax=Bambusicola thoracicus TaxID=9083 RepID=A0A2P4SET6_BAMTH|nr:hypothetical protein CIB84_013624 [Bambusicola thoracicus]
MRLLQGFKVEFCNDSSPEKFRVLHSRGDLPKQNKQTQIRMSN